VQVSRVRRSGSRVALRSVAILFRMQVGPDYDTAMTQPVMGNIKEELMSAL